MVLDGNRQTMAAHVLGVGTTGSRSRPLVPCPLSLVHGAVAHEPRAFRPQLEGFTMKQKDLNAVMAVFFGIAFALLLQNLFDKDGLACDIREMFEQRNRESLQSHRFLIALSLGLFLLKYFIDDIVNAKCNFFKKESAWGAKLIDRLISCLTKRLSQYQMNGQEITFLILAWTCFMIACASVDEKTCVLIPLVFWFIGIGLVQLALCIYIGQLQDTSIEYKTATCYFKVNFIYSILLIFIILFTSLSLSLSGLISLCLLLALLAIPIFSPLYNFFKNS